MGVSGSAPATPVAPHNKHLAHISDPRSPTAGILRTPIEVGTLPPPLPPAWLGPAAPTAPLSAGGELPCGQPAAQSHRAAGWHRPGAGPTVTHARHLPHSHESLVEW
ncbi:hypothetical protein Nmel_003069 [Mimus melanotis]